MDGFDWLMPVKMTAAALLYVAVTALMWKIWRKRKHGLGLKIAIGLFYGLCSVVSNHIAVDYGIMLLNVRDIGPLAAGLFFDPLSGIISGLIGGAERYLAGELWGLGYFTRLACGLSTALAGVLAAVLYWVEFRGKRPSAGNSFLIGAVMEVFHMYAVLITHRDEMILAFEIVRLCSIPMILFTALGMVGCSLAVRQLNGEGKLYIRFKPRESTPLSVRLQRWLLMVTAFMFALNFGFSSMLRQTAASQEAELTLSQLLNQGAQTYGEGENKTSFVSMLENRLTDYRVLLTLIGPDDRVMFSDMQFYDIEFSAEEIAYLRSRSGYQHFLASYSYFLYEPMVFKTLLLPDGSMLVACANTRDAFLGTEMEIIEQVLTDILLFSALYMLISILTDALVVKKLASVVQSLRLISGGNLNETVDVRSSSEFSELSGDINSMVTALKGYIEAAEKRMQDELELAAEIQESALPRVFTFNRRDFEIYALMDPAKQVGGDFYDFFFIDTDVMALVIADVSGKGIPAAMFMMRSKTSIKQMARRGFSSAKLLSAVNDILCEDNDAQMFVTVWIGIIDLKTGVMRCANAGHEYPVLMRAGGEYELLKDKHGLVLAAVEGAPISEYEIRMNPGDRLFVYTDGVPEAINEAEEQYGTARLVDRLNTLRDVPQEQVLHAVHEDIGQFAGSAEQFDDITMLGFTYNGPDDVSKGN